jgi:hypothetical protein
MQAMETLNRVLGTVNQQATEHALAWAAKNGLPVNCIRKVAEKNPVGAWIRERLVADWDGELIPIIEISIHGDGNGAVHASARPLS